MKEFRRGSDQASICDLNFSQAYLTCCSSDKETIHIFKTIESNTTSYLNMLGGIIPYAASEWSFAKV
jgi:hypothetical protein